MRTAVALLLLLVAHPGPGDALRIAVRIPSSSGVAERMNDNPWVRWILTRRQDVQMSVGPEATGDVTILVDPLPVGRALRPALAGLPVHLAADGFQLGGIAYRQPDQVLALRLPPQAGGRRWLATGRDPGELAALANLLVLLEAGARRYPEPLDYLVRQGPWMERRGSWRSTDSGLAPDPGREHDDFAARAAHYARMTTLPGRAVTLRAPPELAGKDAVHRLARDLDEATTRMAARIPLELASPVPVVVEPDHVVQARYLGAVGAAVVAGDGSVHLVPHPRDGYAYLHAVARVLVERAGFAADLPPWIEEGAALWLSRHWFGRDYEDWLPRLAAAHALPTVEEALSPTRQGDASAPLWSPALAAVVDLLPGRTLREKLTAQPDRRTVGRALASFSRAEPPPPRTSPILPTSFLRGISLAMRNGLEVGYHAPAVDRQLDRLRRLGANAVSLMPFAYQTGPVDPRLRYLNDSPASETDVGLIHAAREARARGFAVLWKPHVWVHGESWSGEIAMTSETDWSRWWASYRRFILHHAFLAEWTGSELLSVGVELGGTVEHRREWEDLIADVRRLFSGALTYSGNWYGDYDRFPCWDRLDLVGVDAYFPLTDRTDASPAEVATGAREVADRLATAAGRWNKPVLITEVGYAARRGAWTEPHREGGAFSSRDQATAYRALLSALRRPPWLAGIFAWKVFSADTGDPGESADFRFLGRPAEGILHRYFSAPPPDTPVTARGPARGSGLH